jgi:ubiquinone/menaquinone biosynthesis C-methylase UbiE/DNA-directed RNA polymerase subunit RPC12/RpoP
MENDNKIVKAPPERGDKEVAAKKFIANYELNDYTYDAFWARREYEHLAEVNVLSSILKRHVSEQEKKVIVDVGGAYGRLSPLYRDTFKRFIISDYSTIELRHAQKELSDYVNKMNLVALNVYNVPFKDESIDVLMSVRLIHHIASPEIMMAEMYRILRPGGTFILEVAHKQHLLGFIKALFRGKLSQFFSEEPHRVMHNPAESQGIKEGQESIMFSFTSQHIERIAQASGFKVKELKACSFFRLPFIKKVIPTSILLVLESFAQSFFSWTKITPSLFYVLQKRGDFSPVKEEFSLTAILQCPHCSARMSYSQQDDLQCEKCNEKFFVKNGIFDLRDPKPEEVTF